MKLSKSMDFQNTYSLEFQEIFMINDHVRIGLTCTGGLIAVTKRPIPQDSSVFLWEV